MREFVYQGIRYRLGNEGLAQRERDGAWLDVGAYSTSVLRRYIDEGRIQYVTLDATSAEQVSGTTNGTPADLMTEAELISLLGDDAGLLQARLDQFLAQQKIAEEAAKSKPAKAVSASKPTEPEKVKSTGLEHYDAYRQWLADELHFIKETLEGHYPDRVDIQENVAFSASEKKLINDGFEQHGVNFANYSLEMRMALQRAAIQVIIHFPEIVISNSRRLKHTIRDLYIIINMGANLQFCSRFNGFRAKKSYAEYLTGYGHSHMNSGGAPAGAQQFCLGETEFARLVDGFRNAKWDRVRFEMFAIQLQDYLSWESLEGGPYCRIENIRLDPDSSRNRFQPPNNNHLRMYYNEFLKKYPDVDIQIEDNGYNLLIKVPKTREFWNKVTAITSTPHQRPYDEVKACTYDENQDESHLWQRINQENRTLISRNYGLKFKGVDLKTQLEVPNKPEEKEEVIKMAHESVMEHIAAELEKKLNEHLQDEFSRN